MSRATQEAIMSAENELLLARATAGDADALAALLAKHGPALRALASRLIPHVHQSVISEEDLVQDVYAQAFLSFSSAYFDNPARFFAWLQAVAQNRMRDALDYLNADARGAGRPAHSACDEPSRTFMLELLSSDSRTPSLELREQEARAALDAAFAQLPTDQATALRLYKLERHEIADVAAILDRSPGAIHLLCDRAQRRLRTLLAADRSVFRALA
jgi:RNA polymerase sigma-70 factor (ECF subfamily)